MIFDTLHFSFLKVKKLFCSFINNVLMDNGCVQTSIMVVHVVLLLGLILSRLTQLSTKSLSIPIIPPSPPSIQACILIQNVHYYILLLSVSLHNNQSVQTTFHTLLVRTPVLHPLGICWYHFPFCVVILYPRSTILATHRLRI